MKVFLDVVGCRLNQGEIETFANQFRALGHQIVAEPGEADIAIVNTCTVTAKAAADSRKKIRRASRAGVRDVFATGCWVTLEPGLAHDLPGVTKVYVNWQKKQLVADLLNKSPEELSALALIRHPIPGERARTRAFIKVQEGCDNHCTYCLTRLARGPARSVSLADIQRNVAAAIAGGALEIVLSGVQLGAWGRDLPGHQRLIHLVASVIKDQPVERLRLSSIEPWDFDVSMLDLWQDKRLCRHLHIPLQSGSNNILKRMGRPVTTDQFSALLDTIRSNIPGVAITTDMIVGFPGETQQDFDETKLLICDLRFSGGHVFTYSPRPGTAAFKMDGSVPIKVAKGRNAELRALFDKLGYAFRGSLIGQTADVLWEASQVTGDDRWELSGLTDTYVRVRCEARKNLQNHISSVTLKDHHPDNQALLCKF